METDCQVSLERVHFRTSQLTYRDVDGFTSIYVEESAVPEFDWVGTESELGLNGDRLDCVVQAINQWSTAQGIRIKLWSASELAHNNSLQGRWP